MSWSASDSFQPLSAIQLKWLYEVGADVDGLPRGLLCQLYSDVLMFGLKVHQVNLFLDRMQTPSDDSNEEEQRQRMLNSFIMWWYDAGTEIPVLYWSEDRQEEDVQHPGDIERMLQRKSLPARSPYFDWETLSEVAIDCQHKIDINSGEIGTRFEVEGMQEALYDFLLTIVHENSFSEDENMQAVMDVWVPYAKLFWEEHFPELDWGATS